MQITRSTDAYLTLQACYNAVIYDRPLPQFSWTLEKDGGIRVTTKDKPAAVKLWQATNPEARDFRIETLGNHQHGACQSRRRRLCGQGPRTGQRLDGILR